MMMIYDDLTVNNGHIKQVIKNDVMTTRIYFANLI